MGNGCSKQADQKPRSQGIVTTQYEMENRRAQQQQDLEEEAEEEDAEEDEEEADKSSKERLREWFKNFMEENEADRRSVQTWARLCIWRYFWDFLYEVTYNDELLDVEKWGRQLPSIFSRHMNIKRIAEHTLKKMEKKHRDRVFSQLCGFSDLQGPDIYWDEDLRASGVDGLNIDESDSLDDMKSLTTYFGTLTIDLFTEPTLPVRGKWVSANYTGDIAGMNDENQETSDFVVLTLTKDGWDDLKLITAINNHPRVKKLRAARQKIRMLHGRTVSVLMKNCLRCATPMMEGVSQCFVEGMLEFNEHSLKKLPDQILDYDATFKFRLRNINTTKIDRCGKGCQGNIPTALAELDPDQFFIGSLLAKNPIPPAVAANWEAALRRRRTCGLSMHFYSNIYSNKDMPKQPHEVCKVSFEKCEGSRSELYQDLFENTQPKISKAVLELYRRMDSVALQADRAYWFKFWVTVCKTLFPNSNSVPDTMWDFDFINNHKALCYRMLERDELEDVLKRSKVFDNAELYLSKNHSVDRVLDMLYRNMASMRLRANADGTYSTATAGNDTAAAGKEGDAAVGADGADGAAAAGAGDMPAGLPPAMQMMWPMMMAMMSMGGPAAQAQMGPMIEAMRASGGGAGSAAGGAGSANQMAAMTAMMQQFMGGGGAAGASGVGSAQQQQFLTNQQAALTPAPATSDEFDRAAAESQECMVRLLGIQTGVAEGSIGRDRARLLMAELALEFPILLQAIGGAQGLAVVGGPPVSALQQQQQQLAEMQAQMLAQQQLQLQQQRQQPASGAAGATDDAAARRRGKRMTGDDDSDERSDEKKSDTEGVRVGDTLDGEEEEEDDTRDPNKMKMRKGGVYQRTCGTITDNGVEEEEPKDPDGCIIA
jgi:hypothetical protein